MYITRAYTVIETSPLEGKKKNLQNCVSGWSSPVCLFSAIVHRLIRVFHMFSWHTVPISFTLYTPVLLYGKMSADVEWLMVFSAAFNWQNIIRIFVYAWTQLVLSCSPPPFSPKLLFPPQNHMVSGERCKLADFISIKNELHIRRNSQHSS